MQKWNTEENVLYMEASSLQQCCCKSQRLIQLFSRLTVRVVWADQVKKSKTDTSSRRGGKGQLKSIFENKASSPQIGLSRLMRVTGIITN